MASEHWHEPYAEAKPQTYGVLTSLEALHGNLDRLENHFNSAASRLSMILNSGTSAKDPGIAEAYPGGVSDVRQSIDSAARKVAVLIEYITDLTERIDL